jgi:hypothetical protein
MLMPRTSIQKKYGQDIGLKNAKKGLLNLLFSHSQAAQVLKKSELLTPEEIGGGIFGKILEMAFSNTVNTPSDIFDHFETNEEQQIIAEIFADTKEYPSNTAIEKALCDMIKKIKITWLTQRIEAEKNDLNAVKSLQLQVKSINSLNITLHDG